MSEIKSRWRSVTDPEKRAARRASFVAKVKATRAVWFPPKPVETGKKAASTAKKSTKKSTGKATGAAKKTTGAARKASNGTKRVTNPLRRTKKT